MTLYNDSGITIIIEKYIQQRGDQEVSRIVNGHLFQGGSYKFTNIIDGNNSLVFDGGDKVNVLYKSQGSDSPFSGSWTVEVNGNISGKLNRSGGVGGQ